MGFRSILRKFQFYFPFVLEVQSHSVTQVILRWLGTLEFMTTLQPQVLELPM